MFFAVLIGGSKVAATTWDFLPAIWGGSILSPGTKVFGIDVDMLAVTWLWISYIFPCGLPGLWRSLTINHFAGMIACGLAGLPVASAALSLSRGLHAGADAIFPVLLISLAIPSKLFVWCFTVYDLRGAFLYRHAQAVQAAIKDADV